MSNVVNPCRPSNDGAPPTFSKFEEKKNIEKGRRINTMRRLFWGTPSPPKHQGSSVSLVYFLFSSIKPSKYLQKVWPCSHRVNNPSISCFTTSGSDTNCISSRSKQNVVQQRQQKRFLKRNDEKPHSQHN